MHFANFARVFGRVAMYAAAVVALAGCANVFYERVHTGSFSGKLDVEWIAPNRFIYRPSADRPLQYVAANGRVIQPRAMYTDGGSIPRLFWSAPNFGPWDFAPGYIVHDWLFLQHRCKEADWQAYDIDKAASILAEAIKTQMVSTKEPAPDPVIVWAIYEAVRTPIARQAWDSGDCTLPPPELSAVSGPPGTPIAAPIKIKTIDFH